MSAASIGRAARGAGRAGENLAKERTAGERREATSASVISSTQPGKLAHADLEGLNSAHETDGCESVVVLADVSDDSTEESSGDRGSTSSENTSTPIDANHFFQQGMAPQMEARAPAGPMFAV